MARTLAQMIPKYRTQPLRPPESEEDVFNPSSSVLPSSIEIFHSYRQLFAQCAKMSTGSKLLDLSRVFAKHLDSYAETVLLPHLSGPNALSLEEIATILNTADYCQTTTTQLSDKIKQRIDAPFRPQISFETQSDAFTAVISRVLSTLTRRIDSALEPAWREMRNTNWSRMESVGDQSTYVSVLIEKLKQSVTDTLAVIGKDAWRRSFCDRTVDSVVSAFAGSLVACKPIGPVGAEQMLLDSYAIRKALEELILLRSQHPESAAHSMDSEDTKPTPPASYIKHVTRSVGRLDAILKTLQVSAIPQESLVQAYLIHVADSSPTNFRKILDLKGIRKVEQPALVELFKIHMQRHKESLVEASPLLTQAVNLVPPGGLGLSVSTVQSSDSRSDTSSPGGAKGGFEHLSAAVLAAAKDGVERLQKDREEGGEGRGSGLGKFFKRDGSGGFRFGRETG